MISFQTKKDTHPKLDFGLTNRYNMLKQTVWSLFVNRISVKRAALVLKII